MFIKLTTGEHDLAWHNGLSCVYDGAWAAYASIVVMRLGTSHMQSVILFIADMSTLPNPSPKRSPREYPYKSCRYALQSAIAGDASAASWSVGGQIACPDNEAC